MHIHSCNHFLNIVFFFCFISLITTDGDLPRIKRKRITFFPCEFSILIKSDADWREEYEDVEIKESHFSGHVEARTLSSSPVSAR